MTKDFPCHCPAVAACVATLLRETAKTLRITFTKRGSFPDRSFPLFFISLPPPPQPQLFILYIFKVHPPILLSRTITMLMPLRKRRRLQGQPDSTSQQSTSSNNTDRGSSDASSSKKANPRGRPMKRAEALKPTRKNRTQQEKLHHNEMAPTFKVPLKTFSAATNDIDRSDDDRSQPKLDRLPIEITLQIFFECLEMNMYSVSRHLRGKLSHPTIYRALVLFAYYHEDDSLFGPERSPSDHGARIRRQLFLPAIYRRITRSERITLQKEILGSRWFSVDFLESCMPILSRLAMADAWHAEKKGLEDHFKNHYKNPAYAAAGRNQSLLDEINDLLPKMDDNTAMSEYYRAKKKENANREDEEGGPHPWESALTFAGDPGPLTGPTGKDDFFPFITTTRPWTKSEPYNDYCLTILRVRILPDHVLMGPWTESKIRLLQYLRQGLRYEPGNEPGYNDPSMVISTQALFNGMADAIRELNEKALLVLLELHDSYIKHPFPFRERSPTDQIPYTWPPDNFLPLELFHLVCDAKPSVATGKNQTRLMSLLLRGGVENIPPDDVAMTRWATHAIDMAEKTSPVSSLKHQKQEVEVVDMAKWLLSRMEQHANLTRKREGRIKKPKTRPVDQVYPHPDGLDFADEVKYLNLPQLYVSRVRLMSCDPGLDSGFDGLTLESDEDHYGDSG